MELYSIHRLLNYKLRVTSSKLQEPLKKQLQEVGLTPESFVTMIVIHEHPGITQIEVAHLKRKDQTSTGQILDKLHEKGFINRVRPQTDKRTYMLYLTEAGEETVAEFWQVAKRNEQELLCVLTEQEREQFIGLLDKIIAD